MNKNKILIIHSIGYPFGIAEDFLHKEVLYLHESFSKVVLITRDVTSSELRELPDNCEVIRVELSNSFGSKLLSIFNLFNYLFWYEVYLLIKNKKKINKVVFATILRSISNGRKLKHASEQIILNSDDAMLYFYSYWCDDAALGLAMLRKQKEIRTFCRIHRWDVYFDQNENSYLPFRKFISKRLDAIYSISEDGIKYVKENWNIDDLSKIKLARLGVNNSFDFSSKSEFTYLIVSCSNLIPVKNVHLIAESLMRISSINIKWIHFGDGSEKDRIKNISNDFPENIKFEMKGSVKNNDIISFYKTNRPDLFINVSSSEGIPVSIMEAMSFGIPVIATNVGGTSEIVNNKNGFLLKPNFEVAELTNTIKSFYKISSVEFVNLQEQSFETWKNEYNSELNYSKFIRKIFKV